MMTYRVCFATTLSPLFRNHFSGRILAHITGERLDGPINKRLGGTGIHARGSFQVWTPVTTKRLVGLQMSPDDPIGTNHYTCPTPYTLIAVGYDHSFFGTTDSTTDAGVHTWSILAMAT
jgi:hypothetical protein